MSEKKFWKKMIRLMPKKRVYIEGNASQKLETENAEILVGELAEGEVTPLQVYFDENCSYEIIEREISPSKISCPGCDRKILHGMDYCNYCGTKVTTQKQ